MKNSLKALTKKDWDNLFPVELVEHRPEWEQTFQTEKLKILQSTDNRFLRRIEHFGSSSIPLIKSKPYIDILIEVPREFLFNKKFILEMEKIGYTCLTEPNEKDDKHYMILIKGYHPDGTNDQIFHIHACPEGHEMLKQIEFRDYLIANPARAKEYEALKIQLASKYKYDRSGYRLAKTEFITETLKRIERRI